MLPSRPKDQTHPTPNSTDASLNTTSTTKNQRRRRRRKDDDEGKPPDGAAKPDPSQISSPFACPFYLFDRNVWHNCLRNYTLNRLVDVRLHLTRAHSLPPRCPICGKEFKEATELAEDRFNTHVQLNTCQSLSSPLPGRQGLTRDQFEAVRTIAGRRTGRHATDTAAEKWFEIWDIIFPGRRRPDSPYIRDRPDVQRIRDMNDDILAGEKWRDLTASTNGSSSPLQNLSRDNIATIMERLLSFYRRMYQGDSGHVASLSEEASVVAGQRRDEEPADDRQKRRTDSSTGKQATSDRDDSDASISDDEYQEVLRQRRAFDRRKRRSTSSIGKRTMGERSDSDHEDIRHCLDFDQAGSSARRLKRRAGGRTSLLFQDPPERIDETAEPPEELEDEDVLAKELPFYAYTSMEVESP